MAKRAARADRKPAGARKRYLPLNQIKYAFWVNPALVEECRNAVAALSVEQEPGLTLTALLDRALRAELLRLRRKHLGGAEFPKHKGRLTPGARKRTGDHDEA